MNAESKSPRCNYWWGNRHEFSKWEMKTRQVSYYVKKTGEILHGADNYQERVCLICGFTEVKKVKYE